MTIQFDVSEELFQRLQKKTNESGVPSVEEYVRLLIERTFDLENAEFERVTNYVLQKNAELYRRLA